MNNKVMNKLSYGLFICTAREGDKDNGCIINTAMQVTSDPLRVVVAINKANYTHDMVIRTRKCNLSIISEDAKFDMFKHFGFQSGKDVDKFSSTSGDWIRDNIEFTITTPNDIKCITKGTNGHMSLYVEDTIDLGSHTLFQCIVVDGDVTSDVPSATYDYYHKHIKEDMQRVGTTPEGKTIWRCKICGFEYVGDEIPADYICPLCKHPATDFEKVEK